MGARVLIFGATGQVARALARAAWMPGAELRLLDRAAADLSDLAGLEGAVRAGVPDVVIIAAAYTAVDRAETDAAAAHRVNGEAPGVIARAAALIGAPVIHLSTDYVFNGRKAEPYVETDPVDPLNVYGRSKLAGEEAVRLANPRHLILRTSWVYGPHGSNFVRTMVRLAGARDEVGVVADQQGCPTAAGDIAAAIAALAERLLDPAAPSGTFHMAGAEEATWHAFAEAVFLQLLARGLKRPRNLPIATAAYPTPARRPMNSRLRCRRLEETFAIRLPGFGESLPGVLDEILAGRLNA